MRISQFITATIGLIYSMKTGDLAAFIIFGILAIMAYRKIMFDVNQMEMDDDPEEEGGVEPWGSLERGIRRWKNRMRRD